MDIVSTLFQKGKGLFTSATRGDGQHVKRAKQIADGNYGHQQEAMLQIWAISTSRAPECQKKCLFQTKNFVRANSKYYSSGNVVVAWDGSVKKDGSMGAAAVIMPAYDTTPLHMILPPCHALQFLSTRLWQS